MSKDTVYIGLREKITTEVDQHLTVKDLGDVFCSNDVIQKYVEDLEIYRTGSEENWDFVDSNYIVNTIIGYNSSIDVNMIGATEVLLEVRRIKRKSKVFKLLKIIFISIILFFGAGIAIINFHEDVNMAKSLEKIYFTITGKKTSKPLLITIPYSIGLGVGALMFFNKGLDPSKRRKKEPGPMELELFLYNKDIEQFILKKEQNKNRKDSID